MNGSGVKRSDLVRLTVAGSVFEAGLIRRGLTEAGIRCLVVGEDLEAGTQTDLEENTVLVETADRDAALDVLKEVWSFFERPEGRDD